MDGASGSSSSIFKWSFDVFLSFRGEDTRSNFTSHLNMALRQRGINVFIDNKLSRGEEISASLLKAIEESKISIVIISENYASSSWCLNELVTIIMCNKFNGQVVLPIFYKVDPSQVRKQHGTFGEAFNKLEDRFFNKMQQWRETLTTVSNMSGWVLGKDDEANLIEKVVQEVLKKLDRTTKELHIAKYPVGVDKQVMNLLSHVMSDGITMVGLYGIGGMGKTTLAKALHNRIANDFEGCCFLANIREASKQYEGLVRLQEKLLYEILMDDSIKVNNVHRGIIVLRDRLCSKKILLILDDIDTSEQLQVLAGGRDWFGVGSKVIATTRNHHLLSIHGFDILQKVEGLNDDEALELFSWHAFKNRHPSSDYLDLSKRGAHYCKGLPLALEVLGSFLYSTDHSKFKQILDEEYENSYLDKDIKDILQISYDGLEDDVKEIFLFISCLFARQDIERVKSKLKACSCLGVEKGITKLMNLSLLTINRSNEIEMHDLIQQMGRTIALSDTSKSQKKKKMLLDGDALDVLDGDKVARVVKAIKMNFCQPTELDIDSRAFKNVKNLVLLDVNNVTFSKTLDFLPSSLRWINWSGFPFLSLPSSFSMENLIELKLPYSSIKHFGKGFMNCELLRNIYLRECKFLEEIPDLSAAINLENLSLNGCRSLIKVHESVGSVGRLASLWLSGHVNGFKQCPPYLKLKSLIHLFIADCNNIESYPHYSEEMKSLEYLHFISSNIGKLSPTIGHLTSLKVLRIFNCTELITLPTTIYHLSSLTSLYASEADLSTFPSIYPCSPSLLPNLRVLYLTKCNLTNLSFLETMAHVAPSLRELDLSENNFTSLPSCIVNFKSLRSLVTWCCELLEEIPKVPEGIILMNAGGCISLTRFPDNLADFISFDLEDEEVRQLILMNCDIPEWYSYKSTNNSITFFMPSNPPRKLKFFAPCVKCQADTFYSIMTKIKCKVCINDIQVWSYENGSVFDTSRIMYYEQVLPFDYMWLIALDPNRDFHSKENLNDFTGSTLKKFTVSFEIIEGGFLEGRINIRMCGVHVVMEE